MTRQVPFIGRKALIQSIEAIMAQSANTQVICLHGSGGIGKSRLLAEIHYRRQTSDPQAAMVPIIDFDDLAFASPENVRHRIARWVPPDAFESYFAAESDYQKLQARGLSAATIRASRERVHQAFVAGVNRISAHARVLLSFDTTDHLTQEHPVFQSLLAILPHLDNTVVLLAGRNGRDLHQWLSVAIGSEHTLLINLPPFSQTESQRYLTTKATNRGLRLEADLANKLIFLAQGKPILLDLAVDWRARGISLKWVLESDITDLSSLPPEQLTAQLAQFQQHLVAHVCDLTAPMDRLVLMLAYLFPLDREMLQVMAAMERDVATLFEAAKEYSFIKELPDGTLTLHDVMREMVNTHVWPGIPATEDRRKEYSQAAVHFYGHRIRTLMLQLSDLKSGKAAQHSHATDLPAQAEILRQQLWVLREQRLTHLINVDLAGALELLEQLYETAAMDGRMGVRPRLIQLVANQKGQLSHEQKALLNYFQADHLFNQANYDEAAQIVERLIEDGAISVEMSIRCIKLRGNIHVRQNKIDAAIADFKTAVKISEHHNETEHLIMATNALGWAYRLRGDLDRALTHYQAARQRFHQADDRQRQQLQHDYGLLLQNLAVLLSERNPTRKAAIDLADRVVAHWRRIDDQYGLGTGYRVQGVCFFRTDHSKRALECFRKASEIFEPLGVKEQIAWICSFRGTLYQNLSNYSQAVTELTRALDIGPPYLRAMTLNRLGRVCMQQKDWKKAQTHLQESLRLAETAPDHKYQLSSLAHLIVLAARTDRSDQLESFQDQLEQSLQQIPKPDQNALGIAYLGLAHLALRKNSWDDIPKVVDLLKKGIPKVVKHGAWARTDIVRHLEAMAADFPKIDGTLVREVAARLIPVVEAKEAQDPNYSTVIEILHDWNHWKENKE